MVDDSLSREQALATLTQKARRRATFTLYRLNAETWLMHRQQAIQAATQAARERGQLRVELALDRLHGLRLRIAMKRMALATCWKNAERRRLLKLVRHDG